MATIEVSPTTYEPCDGFSTDDADSPVCADCGWLEVEHLSLSSPPVSPS